MASASGMTVAGQAVYDDLPPIDRLRREPAEPGPSDASVHRMRWLLLVRGGVKSGCRHPRKCGIRSVAASRFASSGYGGAASVWARRHRRILSARGDGSLCLAAGS
jgi:hypothetical protein